MALVDRIAASADLRRASRLREFLLYVCRQALEQGVSVIHEQELGAAVFGRPRSYDTNVDNIVRVNATALRKRLEHYFAEEGAQETIVLEIPRGTYMPVFRRRSSAESAETGSRSNLVAASLSPISRTDDQAAALRRAPLVVALPDSGASRISSSPAIPSWSWPWLTAALLVVCGVLFWQNRRLNHQLERWKDEPAVRAFWGEFFRDGSVTNVVVADTSFALAEDIMQRTIPLTDYLNYNYKRFAEDASLAPQQRIDLAMVLARNNGSVGDFRVAQQILALNSNGNQANLKFARDYTTDAAKQNNLVLIGSQESNPWVDLFADKLNFALQYDPVAHRAVVLNRKPQAGEQSTYSTPVSSAASNSGYGVIAYVPNLSGKGKTLILEGTDSQATAAAGEFMTSGDSLAAFESKFPSSRIPSFEILLRTSQLSGTPIRTEVAAYRVY